MAVTKKIASAQAGEKLSIAKRLGCIMISVVTIRKNTNGKSYIPTPFGAVYARINEVKPGLYCVVELSNGAYALNAPTTDDRLGFINDQLSKFPNLSARDIMDMHGL